VPLAVHMTWVSPKLIKPDPAGWEVKPRVIVTGRSSSSSLPSCRRDTWQH
jgi:hypothetical protein